MERGAKLRRFISVWFLCSLILCLVGSFPPQVKGITEAPSSEAVEPYLFDPNSYITVIPHPQDVTGNQWSGAPSVICDKGVFWMLWREATTNPPTRSLVISNSTDGLDFTEVWRRSTTKIGGVSVERSSLIKDPSTNKFKLYFCNADGAYVWRIYKLADVSDPANFDHVTKKLVLDVNQTTNNWDENDVKDPHVFYWNNTYWMLYMGNGDPWGWETSTARVGLAYSFDGTNFAKYPENPIINASLSGWDSAVVPNDAIVYANGSWGIYFEGWKDGKGRIGWARWSKGNVSVPKKDSDWLFECIHPEEPVIRYLDVMRVNGVYYFYYESGTNTTDWHDLRVTVVDPNIQAYNDNLRSEGKPYILNIIEAWASSLTYFSDRLFLTLKGKAGAVSTTKINTTDRGSPKRVSGATSWIYNDTNKILTVTVTHSSPEAIVIEWTEDEIPVGGYLIPVKKFELLAPWVSSALLIAAVALSAFYVKRKRKKQG